MNYGQQKIYFKNKFISFINPEYIKFIVDKNGKLITFSITMPSSTDETGPVFTEILGIKSFTFDSSVTDADTTGFDDDGLKTHLPATKTYTIDAEGHFLEDQDDKTRDPGQEACETLSDALGIDGIEVFQLTTPAGTVKTFSASAIVGGIGGGIEDATTWTLNLRVSGAIVTV